MECFKVTVETTNSSKDTFSVTAEGHYYRCVDGVCYVVASRMAEVEGFFNSTDNIKKIERIGVGYCPELFRSCQQKSQI